MGTNKILIPSFEVEKSTQGLNRSLWGFVGVISMFTVGIGVFCSHQMLVYVLNITSTFMSDYMSIADLVPIICFALMFGIGMYDFITQLLYSYDISSDKIVKGRIMNPDTIKGSSVALEAAFMSYMIANISDGSKATNANGIKNISSIIELISYNMQQSFVDEFFYTDLYKKKEYLNPKLVKETKHYYIYTCDNKKKLKIYKIYSGMGCSENGKKASIFQRVIKRSLLVVLIFALLSTVDLSIGACNNKENIGNIQHTVSEIEHDLDMFGYTAKKINEKNYRFEKRVSSEKTSYIKYSFITSGQIDEMKFEVYYNDISTDMPSELRYIIGSATTNFSDAEISAFIDNVQKTINGENAYDKLESSNCTIRLGTSSGYVHIHN